MSEQATLHSVIVAMVSLASAIAARHPAMGQCQLERLRSAGIPEHQIKTVIEIARHIRDEAAHTYDAALDEKAVQIKTASSENKDDCCSPADVAAQQQGCGCTVTAGGQTCC